MSIGPCERLFCPCPLISTTLPWCSEFWPCTLPGKDVLRRYFIGDVMPHCCDAANADIDMPGLGDVGFRFGKLFDMGFKFGTERPRFHGCWCVCCCCKMSTHLNYKWKIELSRWTTPLIRFAFIWKMKRKTPALKHYSPEWNCWWRLAAVGLAKASTKPDLTTLDSLSCTCSVFVDVDVVRVSDRDRLNWAFGENSCSADVDAVVGVAAAAVAVVALPCDEIDGLVGLIYAYYVGDGCHAVESKVVASCYVVRSCLAEDLAESHHAMRLLPVDFDAAYSTYSYCSLASLPANWSSWSCSWIHWRRHCDCCRRQYLTTLPPLMSFHPVIWWWNHIAAGTKTSMAIQTQHYRSIVMSAPSTCLCWPAIHRYPPAFLNLSHQRCYYSQWDLIMYSV